MKGDTSDDHNHRILLIRVKRFKSGLPGKKINGTDVAIFLVIQLADRLKPGEQSLDYDFVHNLENTTSP